MTGWNLPPGCTDADIDRAFGGDDEEQALRSWHAKHQKIIDDECDRRQAELDAWYQKATEDLEAEYAAELDKIGCSDARIDWEMDRNR